MNNYRQHLIRTGAPIKQALAQLDRLAADAILFVVDGSDQLIGSLTDGDVRRGFIRGLSTEEAVDAFIHTNPKFIRKGNYGMEEIIRLRSGHYQIIPVVNERQEIIQVINFRFLRSYLPLDAVIMAGGRGSRLSPMTDQTPKPLLKIGDKPIIEHNLDRLCRYGVDDFWISLGYLGDQIEQYLQDGTAKGVQINYIYEEQPLGTIGAVRQIHDLKHEYLLVMNADLLTTLDYEDFFLDFLEKEADMSVATIPYKVEIPYAVIETSNHQVLSLKEKPTYTYYSNGGIYLLKRTMLEQIPEGHFFNSTDLMEKLLADGKKVISYPLRQYWLDIGKPDDFARAQEDIRYLDL